jgi:Zn ribbon nucleic-acid-binding protein
MEAGLREMGMSPNLNFFCPKCRSKNVVVRIEEKYVKFDKCHGCGFQREETVDY